MTIINTDEFGRCLNTWSARRFLEGQGLRVIEAANGALIFTYPGQEQRKVLPLFIYGKGWYFAEPELRRDYVRPEPEAYAETQS